MTVRASGINPEMLRWARERAGYTVEDIARRRQVSSERIQEWEEGKSYPTWRQLEQLAEKDYHRGIGLFFLNEPPSENTATAEFRRLPSSMLGELDSDTLYALRQARFRQEDLRMLLGVQGTGERFILKDLVGQVDANVPIQLASEVRERLDVGLEDQKAWRTADDALKQWRERVEENGIWVFKRSFRQKDIAGFCLNHEAFPVIYLNNGQAKTRQIFTLFHELAHLLFDFNYLERSDSEHYLDGLGGEEREIEIACNRFAGEFLVPSADFDRSVSRWSTDILSEDHLSALANSYKVSREVILRKFLDRGWLNGDQYRERVQNWLAALTASSSSGGNYYATQATYLGQKYLRAAFQAFEDGRIDDFQLADFLGVKGSSLDRLEQYAWE